ERQAVLPVRRHSAAAFADGVDVIREREGHDVGAQAVDDGACLAAGTAVRLRDAYVLAGEIAPVGGELRIECLVELARRVVADVPQFAATAAVFGAAAGEGQ